MGSRGSCGRSSGSSGGGGGLLALGGGLGGCGGLGLLLLLDQLRDLTLLLRQRAFLLLHGLRVLGDRVLLDGDLRLGLRLLTLQLGGLRVQRVLRRVKVVDGERDVALGDLVVHGRRAEGLLVAAEDRVLRGRRAVRDVVGHGRPGERGLVVCHLRRVRRDVGLGRGDVRVDLREVVAGCVVLLAQGGHLVLRLGQLGLDGGGLRLGVGDGVAGGRARQTKHSARQHCDDGQRGDTDPLERTSAPRRPRRGVVMNPLYVSHDGQHSYRKPLGDTNTVGAKRPCSVVLSVRTCR